MTADKDMLREMAQHRGLRLKASRRRKPGGDFGLFGLEDAAGKPVLGIGDSGLEATAAEVEAHLRSSMRSTWESSAEGLPKAVPRAEPSPLPRPAAKPKPPAKPRPTKPRRAARPGPLRKPTPEPKPPPRFVPVVGNMFADLPTGTSVEATADLLGRPGIGIERIVSRGRATPASEPIVRRHDMWIVLLQGAAGLRIEDSTEVRLKPGDHVSIAAGQRHWIATTASGPAAVWMVVHLG